MRIEEKALHMPTRRTETGERGVPMKRTWLSLFYETGYLLVAGVFLLAAPETAFNLLFSNISYGDVLPRLMGTVLLSIGVIFVQIVRMHIEELYTTTIVVRVPLMAVNLALFTYSGNPLFLTLFVIVTLGVVLTVTGYVLDRRGKVSDNRS
jgi:uncharacterized protein YjeT (DUF2065 family)